MKQSFFRVVRLFFTGFAMGIADLIPGVSGGTVAFLSGIYEELLVSIKSITGRSLKYVLKGEIKYALRSVPYRFLVPLALGLFTAIFTLAKVLSHLLRNYPTFVFAFFFGLVLASVWVVLKRVVKWDTSDKVSFVTAAILAYSVVGLIPIETPNTPLAIFLSGSIAVCAMILPGISGSFILLLLGKYQQILAAVTQRDIVTIGIFMGGCVIGLSLFARFLMWLFRNHHDISIAILAGVMLGSMRKIWPWQEVVSTRINSHGEHVPFMMKNTLPSLSDPTLLPVILLGVGGSLVVLALERLHITKEHVSDVHDPRFVREHREALQKEIK
jgi:putative membrane protein